MRCVAASAVAAVAIPPVRKQSSHSHSSDAPAARRPAPARRCFQAAGSDAARQRYPCRPSSQFASLRRLTDLEQPDAQLVLLILCVAVTGVLTAPAATAAVPVPSKARAADTSRPDRWIGTGTPRSCTSRAVVRAVAKGGIIRFRCGPDPVRIEMRRTARGGSTPAVASCSTAAVLVTLSGGG